MLTPTLLSISERYRTKDISPVEVVQGLLARIEAVEPQINAFVLREDPDLVLKSARMSEQRWHQGNPLGVLDGIPVTIKDTIWVRDWPTRSGSRISSEAPAEEDAPAVARLRQVGALIVGKTTTPEFGWKAVTDSPLTGISRNPWNPKVTPGGSSGGAAAAVAADAAFASVGTDAGGSLRIPGSFCGLAALKATRGRVPAYPPAAVCANALSASDGAKIQAVSQEIADIWNRVIAALPGWADVIAGTEKPNTLREHYVFAHGIGWQAIALAAAVIAQGSGPAWLPKLEATLKSISWGKTNDAWQNACMVGDRMNNTGPGIRSTAGYILAQAKVAEGAKAKPFVEQYMRYR